MAVALVTVPAQASQAAGAARQTDPASYVDPIIGSANAGNTYPGAVAPFGMLAWSPDASRYSGPTSGDNAGQGTMRTISPSGYEYGNNAIRGFGLTHVSGAGCNGLSGDIPFFPLSGSVTESPSSADSHSAAYTSTFSHANEHAAPGSYEVALDSGVDVSLAATTRTGSGEFTYPEGSPATMLVRTSDSAVGSSDASVSIDAANRTISGSVTSGNFCGPYTGDGILQHSYYTVYFTAIFDTAFTEHGTWEDDQLRPDTTSAQGGTGYTGGLNNDGSVAAGYPPAGKGSGAYVTFDTSTGDTVGVRVGISYVSGENAAENLHAENPQGTSIDDVRDTTAAAWNIELGRIEVGGGSDDTLTTFYSALYHSLLHPNVTSDVNGEYTGFDLKTHTIGGGQDAQYATFSGWDVYRSQVQLVTMLDPKRGADIAASLLNQANQNDGVWDRWTHNSGGVHVMVGDPSAAALAGIVAFGGTDFAVDDAYESLAQAARVPTDLDLSRRGWNVAVEGERPSLDQFLKYGYYPEGCNAWGCPNETLEMAAADYGLSTLADYLGKDDESTEFATRSQSWQNQFNPHATPDAGYFQGRMANGTFTSGFSPASDAGFVEGTAAQYVWMVQHNVAGLFDAMGGKDAAVSRLDNFFHDESGAWKLTGSWNNNTHANMDNEPSVATPWLYNYAGAPWKAQETVRQTIAQLWLQSPDGIPNGPDGIPGNDDLGEMSSWLVFAAMGIYPENPSRAELTVVAPLFPEIVIHRASGTTLTINAPDAALDTPYIQSMTVDGQAQTATYLKPSALRHDTTVAYELGSSANTSWGTAAEDAPPSDRRGEVSHRTSVSPATTSVSPGGLSAEVTLSAQRLSASATDPVTFSIDAPDGLTPTSATGTLQGDGSGDVAGAPLTLRADPGIAHGTYPVTIHFASAGVDLADATLSVVVGEQRNTLLATSFEEGQPQGEPNVRLDAVGWGDYCCSIGGAESKVQSGDAHTGSQAVVYSGRALQQDASATNVLLDVDVPVTAGGTFGYSVYPQKSGGPFDDYIQNASQFTAVDLLFADGTRLSESGAVADNGASLDPTQQGSVLTTDEWNDVRVQLPESVDGKTIDKVLLSFATGDTFATPGEKDGYLRGWVDDLSLTEPVPPLNVVATDGLTAQAGEELSGALAHFTGGKGADASAFAATIDWGDGSAQQEGTIAAEAGGYSVTAAHTFAEAGDYTGSVSVTDADGILATVPLAITVNPRPPVFTPSIALTASSVVVGGSIDVTGGGFAPGEDVHVSVSLDPAVAVTVTADDSGAIVASLTVPLEAKPGGHVVTALGTDSAVPASANVTVTAQADPPQYTPTIALSSASVAVGGSLTVTGSGFAHGDAVAFTLYSDAVALGSATADADGNVTAQLTIPETVSPGAHHLAAVGALSGPTGRVALTISAAGADASGNGQGNDGSDLAATGLPEPVAPAAMLAALVLLLGAAIVSRRRRRTG